MVPMEVQRRPSLGLEGVMPAWGKNRLVLIAGACVIAGALLVGIPVDTASALRFFLAGVLIGTAIVLITLVQRTWTK